MHRIPRAALPLAVLACLATLAAAPANAAGRLVYHVEPMPGPYANPEAINNAGVIVAWDGDNGQTAIVNPDGSIQPLAGLPGGYSDVNAINEDKIAVGRSTNAYNWVAMSWSQGQPIDLGSLGTGLESEATSIARTGWIAGYGQAADGHFHALRWRHHVLSDLGVMKGLTDSYAEGVNADGHVVGTGWGPYNQYGRRRERCFLYRDGWMRDIGSLGDESSYCEAVAINDHGQIAGMSSPTGMAVAKHAHGFFYDGTTMVDLGMPRPTDTEVGVVALNDHGVVLGWSRSGDGTDIAAFVWRGGKITLLNDMLAADSAGWSLDYAAAFNNEGVIVGVGKFDGVQTGFKATPILAAD